MRPEHRASIERTPEGGYIRFVRHLPYPVEEVWSALTQPERLADWWAPFATSIRVDLREGGSLAFDWPDHDVPSFVFTITRLQPPRLLEHTHTGPGSWQRWELEPTPEGTILRSTYFVQDPDMAIDRGDVVGAHYGLDRLAAALAGSPVPVDMQEFGALHADYAQNGLSTHRP